MVVGGGIAGLAAATGLAERGVAVTLVEAAPTLGGRVRAWPVAADGTSTTMSRGFHAFFRQYYNLRSLLRRSDPTMAGCDRSPTTPWSWPAGIPTPSPDCRRTPPLNLMAFVARSPSFTLRDLARVDVDAALELLDVAFPRTYADYAGRERRGGPRPSSGSRTGPGTSRSRCSRGQFFADPRDFSGGELVAMFHTYFLGSAEGLLFDVPYDDYDTRCGRRSAATWTTSGCGWSCRWPRRRWRTAAAGLAVRLEDGVGGRGRRRGAGDRPDAVAATRC